MSWEPRHERLYKDGVLIRHRIQKTQDGEWEDFVEEKVEPPKQTMRMKAFPTLKDSGHITTQDGMDLRDYFAAQAMEGGMWVATTEGNTYDRDAIECYKIADAMMRARANDGI